jgi:glycyl-tRNA synthetase beta subunit
MQVEAVVNQKLSAEKYNALKAKLDGLRGVLDAYLNAVTQQDDDEIKRTVRMQCAHTCAIPHPLSFAHLCVLIFLGTTPWMS